MLRWLKWIAIGRGSLISLIVVMPLLGFLFSNSFWVFVLSLIAFFVIASIVGQDVQNRGGEQPGGVIWRVRATEEQKRIGWEMWVRMEKIIATVLDEAHRRQIEETMDALEEGPESFYK